MKTYFIAGRVQEVDGTASCSDSAREGAADTPISRSQMSFRKKLTNKLKSAQGSSMPLTRGNVPSGGSLRMKLLERNRETNSAQFLHYSECLDKNYGDHSNSVETRRKSASLQALTSPLLIDNTNKPLNNAERIGGKISKELVNGSSTANSIRGSKSSGLQVNFLDIFVCQAREQKQL
ncbi:unnamed protein product [Anisakis simplex]|uniref:Guanylate cyclase domain-containing protein n=1 Tax=Anisakis simplex TaxID=6269 RepID=A0A3P6N8K4_ANISI|nr:unnamed protein product [Anisakis simplex]